MFRDQIESKACPGRQLTVLKGLRPHLAGHLARDYLLFIVIVVFTRVVDLIRRQSGQSDRHLGTDTCFDFIQE